MASQDMDLQVFYCHGLPGSADEISKLRQSTQVDISVLAPLDFDNFDSVMAAQGKPQAHIIGFSLGAMTALKIAASRQDKVAKVTLIAPAAPLDSGDFLSHMAGGPVFRAAQKGPIAFKLFTTLQKFGLLLASNQIISTMFANSPDADKRLLADPDFKSMLLKGLNDSFGKNRQDYTNAILTYVKPWSEQLARIKSPVIIYHGTEDNWAPIEMANTLQSKIPSKVTIIPFDDLGHYSTLEKAFSVALCSADR